MLKIAIRRAPRLCFPILFLLALPVPVRGGVRREIRDAYQQQYVNQALYLKVPIQGERQVIAVSPKGPSLASLPGVGLRFKVGEQVRVTKLDFRNEAVRFRIAAVDLSRQGEIEFRFSRPLEENFPQRAAFDTTLAGVFTEGLSYREIDAAKEAYVRAQFDRMIAALASGSSSSVQSVLKTVAEKVPAYRKARQEAKRNAEKVRRVERRLEQEQNSRRRLESQLEQLNRRLGEGGEELRQLRAGKVSLEQKVNRLEKEIGQLRSNNRDYQAQLRDLADNLNLKSASADSLSKQIAQLRTSITALRRERDTLQKRLTKTSQQAQRLEKANQKLGAELKSTRREKNRLWDDVRTLTSNRKGLEARYIRIKREKERLEGRTRLAEALHLVKKLEERPEGMVQSAEVFLLSKEIGVLEVEVPRYAGKPYRVRFQAASPDMVKFSEEERQLYESLGKKIQIETSWKSGSQPLRVVLMGGEALRSVAPRDSTEWVWLFQGRIPAPARVSLRTYLVNQQGDRVALESQDFTVAPGDLMGRIRARLSPLSLLAGLLLGICVGLLLRGWFGRSRRKPGRAASRPDFVIQKRL